MKTLEERKIKQSWGGQQHVFFKFTNKKDLIACIEDLTGLKEDEDYVVIYSGGQQGDGLHFIISDANGDIQHLHKNSYLRHVSEKDFNEFMQFIDFKRNV